MANMVAVGALLGTLSVLPVDVVSEVLPEALGPGKERFVEPNREALRRGLAAAAQAVGVPMP